MWVASGCGGVCTRLQMFAGLCWRGYHGSAGCAGCWVTQLHSCNCTRELAELVGSFGTQPSSSCGLWNCLPRIVSHPTTWHLVLA